MNFVLEFDYCALILDLIIMVLFFARKKLPIKRNRAFAMLVICATLAVIFDLITALGTMFIDAESVGYLTFAYSLYYFFQYSMFALYTYYIICWSGSGLRSHKAVTIAYWIPIASMIIAFICNAFNGFIFYFDESLQFKFGPGLAIQVGVGIYYLVFSFIYQISNGELIQPQKKLVVNLLIVFIIACILFQATHRELLIIGFASSIVLLVMYLMVQNYCDSIDVGTNIFNRNLFTQVIAMDIKSRKNINIMVLAMDDFKFINKTFGIEVGDKMLKQVAHYLDTFMPKGIAFRFGADQFCLVYPETAGNMDTFADVILERFRHPWIDEGIVIMMSTTISCIECPHDADTVEDIIDVIDYSVLVSKRRGKGSVVFASEINLNQLREDKAIEKALKLAMDRKTIQVYYQPIYDCSAGKFTAAEALVRLIDDDLGFVSPEHFIPLAEKNGDILRLGDMVFESVCRFIHENDLANTSIKYIEVNVSIVQCMQPDFVKQLLRTMDKYGVKPDQINLEITETAAVNSANLFKTNIEELIEHGIAFSLDDYGSGYSTLGYINQLPFELIKLDKEIVWDAFDNNKAGITLKHTVGMLKELELKIVAEGVETEEQREHLSQIGCNYLQGWFYSKAIPEDVFIQFIADN